MHSSYYVHLLFSCRPILNFKDSFADVEKSSAIQKTLNVSKNHTDFSSRKSFFICGALIS